MHQQYLHKKTNDHACTNTTAGKEQNKKEKREGETTKDDERELTKHEENQIAKTGTTTTENYQLPPTQNTQRKYEHRKSAPRRTKENRQEEI